MDKHEAGKSIIEMFMTGTFFGALVLLFKHLTDNNRQREANRIAEERLEIDRVAADRKDASERRAELIAERDKEEKRADEAEKRARELDQRVRELEREADKQEARCERVGSPCKIVTPATRNTET